jgi:hypothetical protein
VLETETRDRLFVVYSSDSEQKPKTARAGGGEGFYLASILHGRAFCQFLRIFRSVSGARQRLQELVGFERGQ